MRVGGVWDFFVLKYRKAIKPLGYTYDPFSSVSRAFPWKNGPLVQNNSSRTT